MIQGPENLLSFFDLQGAGNCPYWRIERSQDKAVIAQNWDEGSTDTQQSRQKLVSFLNLLAPGSYLFSLSPVAGSAASTKRVLTAYTHSKFTEVNPAARSNPTAAGFYTREDFQKEVKRMKIRLAQRARREKMEKQIAELSKQIQDFKEGKISGVDDLGSTPMERIFTRVLGTVEPYIPAILVDQGYITPGALAGTQTDKAQAQDSAAEGERLERSLEKLQTGLGQAEMIQALEALSNVNPAELKKMLPMLKVLPKHS